MGQGLGGPAGEAQALAQAVQHLVQLIVVGIFVQDRLIAGDGGVARLPRALVEEAGQELGPTQALSAVLDPVARLFQVGRGRVELEQALELVQGVVRGRLVPIGAVPLLDRSMPTSPTSCSTTS